MKTETYNGWTNYETWRVHLEVFDGGDWEGYSPEAMQELVEELLESSSEGIARDYAFAFISNVDWQEIADHYQEVEN